MSIDEAVAELRRLNETPPAPQRLPNEGEVANAEQRLGVEFPEDYRRFLLEASDVSFGTKEAAVVTPGAGHLDLVRMVEDAWELDEVPRDLLPFCSDNGNYFCLNFRGEVVYWDHNGPNEEKWPNLATWIKEVWIEGN